MPNREIGGLENKLIANCNKTGAIRSELFSIAPPGFDVESDYSFCEFYKKRHQISDQRRVAETSAENAPEAEARTFEDSIWRP